MNRSFLVSVTLCLSLASFSVFAVATPAQQPTERTLSESGRTSPQKARSVATRPAPAKPAVVPKQTPVATAKAAKGHGKLFWSRIMGAFRDVHSAEKKPK